MKKIRFLLVALAVGITVASCDKSALNPAPVPGGSNDTPVFVSLNSVSPALSASAVGDPQAGTKAVDSPLGEGTVDAVVHDLWAIQYDATGKLVGEPYYTSTVPAGVAGSAGIDSTYNGLTVQLTASGGKNHTVYFVANTGSASLFTVDNDVTTSAKLEAVMQGIGSEYKPDAATGIPMFGVYSGPVDKTASQTVELKRLAAKVVLRYKSSLSGFTVTGVQLKNVASGMYYCPEHASGSGFPVINTVAGSESHIDYPAEDVTKAVAENGYQKFVWYVPENLRKATAAVLAAGDRTLDKTDGKATFIEITGVLREGDKCRKVTLRALLGDLGAQGDDYNNFDVKRNAVYTVTVDIKGLNEGDYRLSIESFDMSNCGMIVPNSGDGGAVTFDIRKLTNGWQTTMPTLGENAALRAELLWTDNADLVSQLGIDLDKVNGLLTVKSTGTADGNAVVALYDNATARSGEVLWSWHVWVTDYRPDEAGISTRAANTAYSVTGGQVHTYGTEFQKVNGTSRVMMDRNLGATKALYALSTTNAENYSTYGLFYEWGRKDPFPKSLAGEVSNGNTGSTDKWQLTYNAAGVKTDYPRLKSGQATVGETVKNPQTYYYDQSGDWNSTPDDALWGEGGPKSAYDPCPKGWRIAPNGSWDDFGMTWGSPFSKNSGWTGENVDIAGGLYTAGTVKAFFPASGYIHPFSGMLYRVGNYAYVWSSSVTGGGACSFFFNALGILNLSAGSYRAYGFPARCIQYVE